MTSTRLLLGFLAGALSHLIFQGALGAVLHAANLIPALTWSLAPVPPFAVPKTVSLTFWAGLWGIAYAVLEPRLTARLTWWLGGLVFGLAPLAVQWFVVLPLKGTEMAGGFHPDRILIGLAFHLVFGVGVAIIFRHGLALVRRRTPA